MPVLSKMLSERVPTPLMLLAVLTRIDDDGVIRSPSFRYSKMMRILFGLADPLA